MAVDLRADIFFLFFLISFGCYIDSCLEVEDSCRIIKGQDMIAGVERTPSPNASVMDSPHRRMV